MPRAHMVRRLADAYTFPGFRPQARVLGANQCARCRKHKPHKMRMTCSDLHSQGGRMLSRMGYCQHVLVGVAGWAISGVPVAHATDVESGVGAETQVQASNNENTARTRDLRVAEAGSSVPSSSEGAGRGEVSKAGEDSKEQGSNAGNSGTKLEEVVVTAQKREERLQDVPVSVTAISADTLVENNQVRLQDYYSQIPGVTLSASTFGGLPSLTIRGLNTGGGANVAVMVDGIPFGSSSSLVSGAQPPDIDPADLARVEVLKGPQGTLYGANAIGGLLNFVTAAPATTSFSGRVESDLSSIYNGNELGYGTRASVNVPISD